tara:strand:+ start:13127 stop:13927 length:801 start_codon:yes stop_codon:yes gene_type:complete
MINFYEKSNSQNVEGIAYYEQPVSERMRTFLRLEFLYHPMLKNSDKDNEWSTRSTIAFLLEIQSILSRGDVRNDLLNELDHLICNFEKFETHLNVDSDRLSNLIDNLSCTRNKLSNIGTGFLQALKESDFLNTIKYRSSIPGGTCEFDLPEYNHWLRQPISRRQEDLAKWIKPIKILCEGVCEALWVIRESAQPIAKEAINGMYQHNMQKNNNCRLLRLSLDEELKLFPEISGGQHRFTVRFLEWSTVESRAIQTIGDVPFQLSIC